MFGPSLNFTTDELWDFSSTFYNLMAIEEKARVETYWTALLEGMQALFYNLYQVDLTKSLKYGRGFLEYGYEYYNIFFEEGYAEIRDKVEGNIVRVVASSDTVYIITDRRVYKSDNLVYWDDITFNLKSSSLSLKDIQIPYPDGTNPYLLTSTGIYKFNTTEWVLVYASTEFARITVREIDKAIGAPTTRVWDAALGVYSDSVVYLGELNYLNEYVFTSLATATNYAVNSLDVHDIAWVNVDVFGDTLRTQLIVGSSRTTEVHRGLHIYSTEDEEWDTINDYSGPEDGCTSVSNYAEGTDDFIFTGSSGGGDDDAWYFTKAAGVPNFMPMPSPSIGTGITERIYDFCQITDANNFILTNDKIYKYNGTVWSDVTPSVDAFYPRTINVVGTTLIVGTLEGIYKSTDYGVTWTEFSSGAYYFDLPNTDRFDYLSIPTLSGVLTGQVLVEDEDYEIVNNNAIKFLKEIDFDNTLADAIEIDQDNKTYHPGEQFLAVNSLVLLPSLTNIYFKGFGCEDNPKEIIQQKLYTPYLDGVTESGLTNYVYSQYWADHLKRWTHGVNNKIRSAPTISNLTNLYGLIKGVPFAYEDCIYTSGWSDSNYNYAEFTTSGTSNSLTYMVQNSLEFYDYSSGDSINQFDLICSGVRIIDSLVDPDIISELISDEYSDYREIILLDETNRLQYAGISCSETLETKFVNDIMPLCLKSVQDNIAPEIDSDQDSAFYPWTATAGLSIDTTDYENDILTYKLRHLSPTQTYYTGSGISVTIDDAMTETPEVAFDQQPIVTTSYRFSMEVDDLYNNETGPLRVYVSGVNDFDSWGDNNFSIADVDIEFDNFTQHSEYVGLSLGDGILYDFSQPFIEMASDTSYIADHSLVEDDNGILHIFGIKVKPGDDHSFGERLSHWTSSVSSNLRNWVEQDDVLDVNDGYAEDWENEHIWAPHVIRNPVSSPPVGEKWVMSYAGVAWTPTSSRQQLGLAFSDDLYTWVRASGVNPLLDMESQSYFIWPEAAWSAQCRDPHFTYNEDEGKWFLTFSAKKDDGEADPWDNPGCIGVLEWQGSGNDFASDWVLVSGQESLIVFDTNAVPEGQSITKIDDTWHMVWNFSATGMQHQSNTSGMWGPWETNPVDVGWADDVGYAPEITWVNGLSKWILSMHQASSKNYYMFRELDFDTLDVNGSPTITDLNTLDKCPGSWSITDLSGDDINNNHPSWSDDINISIQPVVYYNGRRYINMIDNNLNNTPVVSGLSVWMDQTRFGTPVQPYDLPWDSEVNYRYYTINEDLAPYSKSVLSLTSSGDNKPPTSTLTYGDSTISGYLTSETFTINNNRVSFYLSAPENDSDFFVALVDANTDKVRLLTTGSSNQSEGPQDDNGQQFYSDYSMVQKLWDTTSLMGQDVYVVIAKLGLGHFMLNYLQEYHETVTGNDPVAPEHPSLLSQAVIITSLLP